MSSDQSDVVWPLTPDSISSPPPAHTPACDSGFVDSITQSLDIQCLECVLDDPSTGSVLGGSTKCTCSNKKYDGFEDYNHDIYLYKLQIEPKYHVANCLNNQPDVSTISMIIPAHSVIDQMFAMFEVFSTWKQF